MKKIIILFFISFSLILFSCNIDNDITSKKVVITFVIDENIKTITFNEMHIITNQDLLELNFERTITIEDLFYDNTFDNPYNGEQLISNTTLYILKDNGPMEENIQTWTNDNAIYANIKSQYAIDILSDVEGAFDDFSFKKVYVVNKTTGTDQRIYFQLLFILNDNEQQEFIDLLLLDERINSARKCKDLPFENIDNRYLDIESSIIKVGETLDVSLKGDCRFYYPPFEYDGFWVKISNYNENSTYSINDFSQVNLASITKDYSGRLYFKLAESGYFNVIKAIDTLSRLSTIQSVEFIRIDIIMPIWQISDRTIADFAIEYGYENYYNMTTIVGLKPGEVTIDFDGIYCKITVID